MRNHQYDQLYEASMKHLALYGHDLSEGGAEVVEYRDGTLEWTNCPRCDNAPEGTYVSPEFYGE